MTALDSFDRATVWLNSEPLTAAGLAGRVVLVDFWTYSCVNWLRTLPYVSAWAQRYAGDGLVVVGVHAPEFSFEHDLGNVRHAVEELGVGYPVVTDNEFAIWRAFENHYWPAVYLVDRDGRVGYHHFGEEAYEETEQAIQERLGVDRELVDVAADGFARPADWERLRSPETYVGTNRGERRVAPGGELGLNDWALHGEWMVDAESATLQSAPGSIAYRFEGRDLNLVMAPSSGPVRFTVQLDGGPPGEDGGLDAGTLDEPRMYQLVRARGEIRSRTCEITFLDPGARAFVFTFG